MSLLKIEEFYSKIKQSVSNLDNICQAERDYINSSFQTPASRKYAFTEYRRAIAKYYLNDDKAYKAILELSRAARNFDADNKLFLKVAAKNSISASSLKQAYKTHRVVCKYLALNVNETTEIQEEYKTKVKNEMSNLKQIKNLDGLLNKATLLLSSQSYINRILGLALLTGRRVAEIACSAKFEYQSKDEVIFTGQLKTKLRECGAYTIPTLADASLIIKTLKELRADKPEFINKPQYFHNVASKNLSSSVKKHFSEYVEGEVTAKDLRALYATIACYQFKQDARMHPQAYIANILGHDENDLNTVNSYNDYYI